jgi:hypothetical protein
MGRWLKSQFSSVERARRIALTVAMVFSTTGFCVLVGALLLGRRTG